MKFEAELTPEVEAILDNDLLQVVSEGMRQIKTAVQKAKNNFNQRRITMKKDKFGNPMGIKKNNVVIIHDRTYTSAGHGFWGTSNGELALVTSYGCVEVTTITNNGVRNNIAFNESDLEVIGTL